MNSKRSARRLSKAKAAAALQPVRLGALRAGLHVSLIVLSMSGVLTYALPQPARAAGPSLPSQCTGGACGRNAGNVPFVSYGNLGNNGQPVINGNTMTINQLSDKAILNWKNFDIGKGYMVNYNQPGSSSATLNRIWSIDPSVIAGKMTANGQIYLINGNGIIFDKGAQIDVGSLTASTLNIKDDLFLNGILSGNQNAAAALSPVFTLDDGNPQGYVVVNPGAELRTANGGRVMLLAPNVTNNGVITTPDGQTIIAAGSKAYLAASQDASLRGLLIEVDGGGNAINGAQGTIVAEHGNVTLAGLLVNQSGRITATTSVNANGSIYLVAGDVSRRDLSADPSGNTPTLFQNGEYLGFGNLLPNQGGSLKLGPGSVTEVRPDLGDKTTITDKQTFAQSTIGLVGKTIALEGNAAIIAPGGNVDITAAVNPYDQLSALGKPHDNQTVANDSRIYLDSASVIDVSGSQGVQIPIERNLIAVELRGNELQDDPLQRDGFLHGKTVYIDAGKGSPLVDLQPYKDNLGRTIAEKVTAGGNIKLSSEGDVIARAGSTLNVSGGSINYQNGYGRTTKLLGIDGKVYDIGVAPKDIRYVGFADQYSYTDSKWGFSKIWYLLGDSRGSYLPGYSQGASAGRIDVIAPQISLQGALLANTVPGPYQRDTATLPLSGLLNIGDAAQNDSLISNPDFRAPDIVISDQIASLPDTFDENTALAESQKSQVVVSPDALAKGGINRLGLYSSGAITVPAGTSLALSGNGASVLALAQDSVNVAGTISLPSGSVSLTSRTGDVGLREGSAILARGSWINDAAANASVPNSLSNGAPILPDGGNIALSAFKDIVVEKGSLIDVSGGGWISQKGKLKEGKGGNVSLAANTGKEIDGLAGGVQLGGELRSYGLVSGGSLSISSATVTIGEKGAGRAGELLLRQDFFTQGGFANFKITGQNGLAITEGAAIKPVMQNLVFNENYLTRQTGTDIFSFADIGILRQDLRSPVSVNFSTSSAITPERIGAGLGDLSMAAGSSIMTDPGASVTLSARENLTVRGTIDAPAGSISLNVAPGVQVGTQDIGEGFIARQSLLVGKEAHLSAQAYAQVRSDNSQGYRNGKVMDGGQINLNANKGYVITEAGSVMDVSGTGAVIDIVRTGNGMTSVQSSEIAGAAGFIGIHAREGMVLKGDMTGRAATVTGAAGGSLSLGLDLYDRATDPNGNITGSSVARFPTGDRNIVLTSKDAGGLPGTPENGVARISAAKLAAGGFDVIKLKSADVVSVDGAVNLSARRSVTLDAPVLAGNAGATANISAAYVAIGNSNGNYQPGFAGPDNPLSQAAQAPTSPVVALKKGDAQLNINGQLVDIRGNSALSGFKTATYTSSGDIRLTYSKKFFNGLDLGTDFTGSLNTLGDLTLQAAQIYPVTLAQFTINKPEPNPADITRHDIVDAPGKVTILPNGTSTVPLSAGGSLIIYGEEILQQGVLRAPLGQIALNGTAGVTLDAGSLTSVSAEGRIIPVGKTQNGKDWVYEVDGLGTTLVLDAPLEKKIALNGAKVAVKSGAAVDLSGSGDLYAYEFTVGPGGSKDVLSKANGAYWAIMPSLGPVAAAPIDQQYGLGSSLNAGDAIYLSALPGVPAGYYTLLPARYALLPGAYAVKPVSGYTDIALGTVINQRDGSQIVAGYRAAAGGDIRDSRTAGFLLTPGSVVRTQSQYADNYANAFFANAAINNETAAPRLPVDAGSLQLAATDSLVLDGSVAFSTGRIVLGKDRQGNDIVQPGRGGEVSVSAPKIAVVDQPGAADGFLQLAARSLNQLNAESLVLGATRTTTASGDKLDASATDTVELRNSAGNALVAPEIILAASNEVTAKAGSAIQGKGALSNPPKKLLIDGDGALLRVTGGAQATLIRSPRQDESGNDVPFARGTLNIEQGASVLADGSAIFDGALDTRMASGANIAANAVSLSASQINLGEVPSGTAGLNINSQLLDSLKGLTDLAVHSYHGIDFYGAVDFGAVDATGKPLLGSIGLDAAGLLGHGTQNKSIRAGTIAITNTGNKATLTGTGDGAGRLTLAAADTGKKGSGQITLGEGDKTVQGFGGVDLIADRDIQGENTGTLTLNNSGDLNMQSARVSGAAGADQRIDNQSGKVGIARSNAGIDLPADGMGSKLAISGTSITQNGLIDLPAGILSLQATAGDLILGSASQTSAAGAAKQFGDTYAFASAGTVSLSADHGSVNIQAGATVDVSGAIANGAGGDAGSLIVSTPAGQFNSNGTLKGSAVAGQRQGSFQLDAGSLGDFVFLDNKLATGGFGESIDLRARSGNVALNADVAARTFVLSADQGNIDISAKIDASGKAGGKIALWSGADLNVLSGAGLLASASGDTGKGGQVTLGSANGFVDVQSGSKIDVRGGTNGTAGSVLIRAPRTSGNSDVQVRSLAGEINAGANPIVVEGVKVYTVENPSGFAKVGGTGVSGNLPTTTTGTLYTQTSAFANTAPTIAARLGQGGANVQVRAGIEVQSHGDLQLASDLDLSKWHFQGVPVNLTMRPAGTLDLNASLSDGFNVPTGQLMKNGTLMSGDSASYRLAGGADLTAANPLAVQTVAASANHGNVVIEANSSKAGYVVRTGNGGIDIAAAGDVKLMGQTAVIYTAGTPNDPSGIPVFFDGQGKAVAYPVGGGDITIAAGHDVIGARTNQLFSNWLLHQGAANADGTIARNVSWGIDFIQFQQGIATLGGGNVSVKAGNDITNLSASAPSTGWLAGAVNTLPDMAALHVQGGGDVKIEAGRDIRSGTFYADHGNASIAAGGAIVRDSETSPYPILALAGGHVDMRARKDLTIETAFNPFILSESARTSVGGGTLAVIRSYFYTYNSSDAVSATSVAGSVNFNGDTQSIRNTATSAQLSSGGANINDLTVYPPTLNAVAMQGDVNVNLGSNSLVLFPSATGNLNLLASGNIAFKGTTTVSETDPAKIANPLLPAKALLTGSADVTSAPLPASPLHQNDAEPIRVIALTGTIDGNSSTLKFPKQAEFSAGQDIKNLRYQGKNLSQTDVTSFSAGRDIVFDTSRDVATNELVDNPDAITIGGPGQVQLLAGRNVNLGNSIGVVTRGNLDDARLPSHGAAIVVATGLGTNPDGSLRDPDYQAFIGRYIAPSQPTVSGAAEGVRKSAAAAAPSGAAPHLYTAELTAYMRQITGKNDLTDSQALDAYQTLPKNRQLQFIANVLYAELHATGIAHNQDGVNYDRGYQAIATLFPKTDYKGDLNLFFSQLKTEQGGDVDLLVPGGSVVAGLVNPPAELNDLKTKSNNPPRGEIPAAAKLGILVVADGAVRGFAKQDFAVNQSRILTLQGGDILLWASDGSIDAGKGAKTASGAPPPVIQTKDDGTVIVNAGSSISGSGIGQLLTIPGIVAGSVDLIAPKGEVNAGDAGIRVAGNLNIAALRVIGGDNISVGGIATGVPVADTGSLAGALTGTGGLGDTAKNTSEQMTRSLADASEQSQKLKDSFRPSFITVEVICLGESCK